MTRINVIPVEELTREHLVAEYKEIMRLPNNLKKSLNRKTKPFCTSEIPTEYKMGKGHVKFFYDKFGYLKQRFESLLAEMIRRGYNPNYLDSSIFVVDNKYMNGYTPTNEALRVNRERIKERLGL